MNCSFLSVSRVTGAVSLFLGLFAALVLLSLVVTALGPVVMFLLKVMSLAVLGVAVVVLLVLGLKLLLEG